jgi:S-adenosylmethionine synthetase
MRKLRRSEIVAMFGLVISPLQTTDAVEVVERKGIGHPDSICDALAETFSRNLCNEYQRRFGEILHHNVDKALLCGGHTIPAFGGGRVIAPIDIHLVGRVVGKVGNEVLPVEEIAVEGSRAWLNANFHALDADNQVRVNALVQRGSQDLQTLFSRRDVGGIPLGHAPMSALERLVLAIDERVHSRDRANERPAWGEDTKVMAVRCTDRIEVTAACAMIGRFLANIEDYLEQKVAFVALVRELAIEHGFSACDVTINAADDASSGSIYLTVTGTSAEAGDDGQVGRGNRVNGLITPCRPMSLEAAAVKNPVSHVGKIYNVLATEIAETLVSIVPEIASAQCMMVSKIGTPVSSPALVETKLATRDGRPFPDLKKQVEELVRNQIAGLPRLIKRILVGEIKVF